MNSKNTIPDELNLGAVTITKVLEAEPPYTIIDWNIPMRVQTYIIDGDLKRYEEILTDSVRLKIGILFQMVEFLGTLGYQGDYHAETLGEFHSVLGAFGQRLSEALENIQNSFDRFKPNQIEKPNSNVGEKSETEHFGELTTLANQISAAMKNPLIPTGLFNAMADELTTEPNDWRAPEAILTSLQDLRNQEVSDEN